MSKPIYKFYDLEHLTQEDLNKLALERNTLHQENQQLKIDYELYKDNCVYRNYEVEIRDNTIKQLKEIIEEVREVINRMVHYGYMKNATMYMATSEKSEFGTRAEVLLQILDKIKDVK